MPKRNKFSRSHYNLMTCNMGELIPVYWDEVLPGDVWQQRTSALIRLSAQVYPTMHPVRIRLHHWYIPTRLIWEDYEDFFTGGDDGTVTPQHPHINYPDPVVEGSLFDYMGIPTGSHTNVTCNALPFRAYAKIYNEHYRDQDLCSEKVIDLTSGVDTTTDTDVQKVAWEKDRFTTCRSTTQRGDDISIPLVGDADVLADGGLSLMGQTSSVSQALVSHTDGQTVKGAAGVWTSGEGLEYSDVLGGLKADLSSASGVTLEDLRLAIGKQRYMEIMQRAGARYGEYARAIFGVNNPDSRLQIPEYLGGGRQTVAFSEILATAEGINTEVGDLKGHGIAAIRTRRYRRFVPEHGFIMTLMSVVPRAIYTQSLDRQMIRNNNTVKEDYFVPQLQGIGDDEILNREVYSLHSNPNGIFGYQNRYEEYRSKDSRVSGSMRSSPNYNRHLGRIHSSNPALNSTFIECNPSKRIFADTISDSLQCMISHSIQTRRPVGRTGMPSKI